ncbi:MAG: hydrogenase maturation nickel metallochaperone HypA [Actinomycetota bacterium]|nr:hydrogenase maturation nickel metallochaperone HypA [Actinomycetota bacterium]
MHELSISRAIAETVRRHAAGRRVGLVRVEVGQLRQVVPDTLRHCWGLVVEGSDLDGAGLEVVEVPATLECRACGSRRELTEPVLRCEGCGATDVAIVSGEELLVTSYDLRGA